VARSPAAILGHTLPGVAVLENVPWRYVLAGELLGVCWVAGAVIGIGVALVKMRGERRGN
jgi:hypothetical protein